jgi:hypothetical protein
MNGLRLNSRWSGSRRSPAPIFETGLAWAEPRRPERGHTRIVVVGNTSSGKTWLANTLGAIAAVPVVRDQILRRTPPKGWIVESSFGELTASVFEGAQALVWLHLESAGGPACPCEAQAEVHDPPEFGKLVEWALNYRLQGESFASHLSQFRRFDGWRLCIQTEEEAIRLVDSAMQVGVSAALADAAGLLNSPRWR